MNYRPNNKYIAQQKAKDLCYLSIYGDDYKKFQKIKYSSFQGFESYLKLAYNAANKRKNAGAKYTIIDRSKDYKLSTWLIIKVITKLAPNGKYVNDEAMIESLIAYGSVLQEIQIENITVDNQIVEYFHYEDSIIFKGEKSSRIVINGDSNILFDKDEFKSRFVNYYGKQLVVRKQKVQIDDYLGNECSDTNTSFIQYTLQRDDNEEKEDEITLELIDDNTSDISIYDIFFNDNSKEVYFQNEKDKFTVTYANKESGRIVIRVPQEKRELLTETVYLATNTNTLKRQSNALKFLVERPALEQKTLLNLTESKRFYQLPEFKPQKLPIQYTILTDESREGTHTQRDFVQKAMQTPDFMILQGPPGSGKTTTILELIYQLASQGKKILLSASTHVAIDNVLEKIIQHENKDELLRVINPVRVGDEKSVYSECVKDFIYSDVIGSVPEFSKRMVEESFNLVCGTTIGVLNFPLINDLLRVATSEKNESNDNSSIEPIFDYVILDEASKTTFSEFLVSAVLAKRWIIVGDVKQLSPYVEKDDLIPSLLTCPAIKDQSKREAISCLLKFRRPDKIKNFGFILSKSSIVYIDKNDVQLDKIIAVTDASLSKIFSITSEDVNNKSWKLNAINTKEAVFVIEEGLVDSVLPYLNKAITLLHPEENLSDPALFHLYSILHARESFNKDYYDEYKAFHKRLEDEILWRLIRLYELSDQQNATTNYLEYLDSVKHVLNDDDKKSFEETINTLSNIAIPSIIRMLQEGINKNSQYQSILTAGFSENDKKNRFVKLEYQHRMHPEISIVSRNHVYENQALNDSATWKSKLHYPNAKKRFDIRHVEGPIIRNNTNEAESDAIIQELEFFMEFLKKHPKTNKEICTIGILAFYNGQVIDLRKKLKKLFNTQNNFNFFNDQVHVSLNSVDRFQGQEADVIYLSMVQNDKVGFLDSINRVNVAITRAKEQIIIFGDKNFFASKQTHSELLKEIFKGGQ